MQNVFSFRDKIIDKYSIFSRSFSKISAADILAEVERQYGLGRYWPEPLIQINPNYLQKGPEHLQDDRRRFTLTINEIALLNPNTRTCPTFRSQADSELTKKLYRLAGVFINEGTGDARATHGMSVFAKACLS